MNRRNKETALIVRAAQLRILIRRMSPADFLPWSELGAEVDRVAGAVARLILA